VDPKHCGKESRSLGGFCGKKSKMGLEENGRRRHVFS
jgi:hypothetical protein